MTAHPFTPLSSENSDDVDRAESTGNIVFASAGSDRPKQIGTNAVVDGIDPGPEHAFDRIAELAAHLFDTHSAFISLIEENHLWFKAAVGIDGNVCPLETSFCIHAFEARDVLVVPDASQDDRFANNPLVTATPGIRFYVGTPLITDEGDIIGSICVLDPEPRNEPVDSEKIQHLLHLADVVMDELELRREIRRREDRERELRDARNKAESAKETMSQFFAGITHDLRTPLTRILLFNDLLERVIEEPRPGKSGQEYIEKIRGAGTRMNRLITSLLELAELRSGRLELELVPVNVLDIVTAACEGVEMMTESQVDRLSMHVPDAPLFARADSSALTRVMDNLIGNAIKHTGPDDQVHVTLRLPKTSQGGDSREETMLNVSGDGSPQRRGIAFSKDVRELPARGPGANDNPGEMTHIDDPSILIEIADNGPGIPDELIDTLFDPYTRGPKRRDGENDSSSTGVGLGLAITSDLVQAMNGAIHVHTSEGIGTCFHIHLPAVPLD